MHTNWCVLIKNIYGNRDVKFLECDYLLVQWCIKLTFRNEFLNVQWYKKRLLILTSQNSQVKNQQMFFNKLSFVQYICDVSKSWMFPILVTNLWFPPKTSFGLCFSRSNPCLVRMSGWKIEILWHQFKSRIGYWNAWEYNSVYRIQQRN